MHRPFILVFAILLVVPALLVPTGCGGSDKKEEPSDNPWAGSGASSDSGNSSSGWSGSNRTGSNRSGNSRPDDGGSDEALIKDNDRRIREAIRAAETRFEDGEYENALKRLQKARELVPHSDDVHDELKNLHLRVATFNMAFQDITPLGTRDNYVKVVFHGGGTVIGFLLEEDERAGTLLIKRQIGGYETVDRNDSTFAELQKIDESKQRREMDQAYGRLQYEFSLLKNPDAVEQLRFAQTAWRYGKAQEAHRRLADAFKADPDLHDTVLMEGDAAWADFREATATGNRDAARKALDKLRRKYPNAHMFKEARRELGRTATVERTESDVDPKVADFIFGRIDRDAADQARNAEGEIAIARSAGSDLAKEMAGSSSALIAAADRHLKAAEKYDNESRPGEKDADIKLEKAVFHYRCAQDLLRKASDRGASASEVESRLVQANKGLFWCRKRMPLH